MEGIAPYTPIVDFACKAMPREPFTVIDIGCGMGIDEVWRRFGDRLCAIGFDPNAGEIERLTKAERHPGVKYVAAFAGLPPDHELLKRKAERGGGDWPRNPWLRLSAYKTLEAIRLQQLSNQEQTDMNLWGYMDMKEIPTIVLPDYLKEQGVSSVDFIKIDVDGKDWEILNSLDTALDELQVMAVALEVSYFGSADDTDNTFHNMDRFMKGHSFELFNLTQRRFSVSALPSRYVLEQPAQTESGRVAQGDAFYVRDIAAPEHHEYGNSLSTAKLLNLVCLNGVMNLTDCAAEILIEYRDRFEGILNVDAALDVLVKQALGGYEYPYSEYIRRFEAADRELFSPVSPSAQPGVLDGAPPTIRSFASGLLRRWSSLRNRKS